jgi:nucleoid-associated protein YgaU
VRLTRRGRLARSGALAALLVLLALSVVDVVGGGRALAADTTPRPVTTRTVVVEQGDSLWLIAQRAAPEADPREVVTRLRELNGMRSNLIQPGQVLLVPTSL